MTSSARSAGLLTSLLVAGICASVTIPAAALGQAPPATTGGVSPNDEGRTPLGGAGALPTGGGYDYFTAHLHGDLESYLGQVTQRHASERVWAQFWAGKYTETLGDCEYVLARFPNHPRALHLLGEVAKATNDVSLPIGYFENALRLYPQYAFTHAQYGHYLSDIGAYPAGVAQLREALRLEPGQFQAKAWLEEALAAHPELAKSTGPEAGPSEPSPGAKADAPKTDPVKTGSPKTDPPKGKK